MFALGFTVTFAICLACFRWTPAWEMLADRAGWSDLPAEKSEVFGKPSESDGPVTLAFVGDIRLAATQVSSVSLTTWKTVRGALAGADLGIGNLETTLAGGRPAERKQYTFQSPPDLVGDVRSVGIGVLSLANNHALDYGQDALLETIRRARAGGVRTVGAGRDADEAYEPEIVELRGMRIGFLSFSRVLPDRSWAAGEDWPGVASGYSPKRVLNAVDSLAAWVDAVVVLMHWGNEAQDTPLTADRELAEQLVRHGATAVVGHHPHVVQGVEWTHGSFIAYSLGNFLFPGSRRTDSGVLVLTLRKGAGVIAARFVPLRLSGGAPQRVTAAEAGKALERLGAAVAPAGLSIAADGEILARSGAPSSSEHTTGGTP